MTKVQHGNFVSIFEGIHFHLSHQKDTEHLAQDNSHLSSLYARSWSVIKMFLEDMRFQRERANLSVGRA